MTAAAAEQASSSSSSDSSSAGMKRARPSATTRPVLKRAAKGDTINDKMLFVGLRTKKRGREPHQLDDVVNSVPDATSMLVEQTQATGAREDGKGKRPILLPSSGVYGDDNEDYQRYRNRPTVSSSLSISSNTSGKRTRNASHLQPAGSLSSSTSSSEPIINQPYLASASTSPWSIGANDDATSSVLAFSFSLRRPAATRVLTHDDERLRQSPPSLACALESEDSQYQETNGGLVDDVLHAPPSEAVFLAPFLFEHTDGDELHPRITRRSSSLPAGLSSSSSSSLSTSPPDLSSSTSLLEGWQVSTLSPSSTHVHLVPHASLSMPSSHTSSSSFSSSSSQATSSVSSGTSSNQSATTSPPSSTSATSPTSSADGKSESSISDSLKAHLHLFHSSPFSSKRSSETFQLDTVRLKKRKLSHRIRSFLLLRPPGYPLPGIDGAHDINQILKAPAWLKNATSDMSRESRMKPMEWYWSGHEIDRNIWNTTTLERKFESQLKVNAQDEKERLEDEMRMDVQEASEFQREHEQRDQMRESETQRKVDEMREITSLQPAAQSIPQSETSLSPVKSIDANPRASQSSGTSTRTRQVSAPPVMEADPYSISNAALSPHPEANFEPSQSSTSSSTRNDNQAKRRMLLPSTQLPPEVLKSQLLAVLRSRLPDGAKSADAPLRLKKFVVWNAWIRRATMPPSRQRYAVSRSTSPERSHQSESSPSAPTRHERRPALSHTGSHRPPASPSPSAAPLPLPSVSPAYVYIEEPLPEPLSSFMDLSSEPLSFKRERRTSLIDDHEDEDNDEDDQEEEDFDPFSIFDDDENDDDMFGEVEEALHESFGVGSSTRRYANAFDTESSSGPSSAPLSTRAPETTDREGPFLQDMPSSEQSDYPTYEKQHHQNKMDGYNSLRLHSPSPIHLSHSNSSLSNALLNESNDGYGLHYSYSQPEERRQGKAEHEDEDDEDYHYVPYDTDATPRSLPGTTMLQLKGSTATPPSQMVDLSPCSPSPLSSDLPHHHLQISEAAITPFWFDQDSVHFDDEDGQNTRLSKEENRLNCNHAKSLGEAQESSPSISPNERKDMASCTTSRVNGFLQWDVVDGQSNGREEVQI